MKNILPNKMWELLKLAQKDLRAVEKDPKYIIDMGTWVEIISDGKKELCVVCLAGAAMVKRFDALNQLEDSGVTPSALECSPADKNKLRALDYLRGGFIYGAWLDMWEGKGYTATAFKRTGLPLEVSVANYNTDKKQFHRDITKLIKLLKEKDV